MLWREEIHVENIADRGMRTHNLFVLDGRIFRVRIASLIAVLNLRSATTHLSERPSSHPRVLDQPHLATVMMAVLCAVLLVGVSSFMFLTTRFAREQEGEIEAWVGGVARRGLVTGLV